MSETTLPGPRHETRSRGSTRGILLTSLGVGTLIAVGIVLSLSRRPAPGAAPASSGAPEPASHTPEAAAPPAPPEVARPSDPQSVDLDTEIFFRMIRLSHATDGSAPARNPRSAEEALFLAADILRDVRGGGATFEDLARQYSDHPTSVKGGAVQRMRLGQLPPAMRDALQRAPEGEPAIAPMPDENAYFVLMRLPLPPMLAAQQILVRYSETSLGGAAADRSREEALALARQIVGRALEDGADFDALVGELSEDPGKYRGGRIGPVPAEMLPVELADAISGVDEWQVVPEPVPADLGYYVLRRIPLEETEPPVPPDDPVPAPTAAPDPARVPRAGATAPVGERAAGFEILISYEGAAAANLRIKRSRERARERAQAIVDLARSAGQDFEELVERYSDDRSVESSGGSLGVLHRDRPIHVGHEVVFALEPLQVSDVFESERGFHVFRRMPLEEVGLRDIVVTYAGAMNASPNLERTREEARVIVLAALARLDAGESFRAVAGTISDQRRSNGGALGVLHRQHPFFRQFPEHLQRAFQLEIGQHSDVFESAQGFHIIQRDHVLRARHLRISYAGKLGAPAQARTRQRAAAEGMMEGILAELAAGRPFRELVVERSEDPDARRGGDLGVFGPGQRDDALFEAVAALEPGGISGVIETRFGLELAERLPLEGE